MLSDNLERLASDVATWRAGKSQGEKLPIEYVERAFALSKQISQSEVERKAKVFRYQYKRLKAKSEEMPPIHKIDLLTPHSLSIELGSGMRIDCQVGSHNFADVITTLVRSLRRSPDA